MRRAFLILAAATMLAAGCTDRKTTPATGTGTGAPTRAGAAPPPPPPPSPPAHRPGG